jgi:hypothetical protein
VRTGRRIVLSILAVGLALYLLILVWFWANQDSLVFFPEGGRIPDPPAFLGGEARAARFTGQSGRLVAWVIPPTGSSGFGPMGSHPSWERRQSRDARPSRA